MGMGQTSAQRIVKFNDFKNDGRGKYREDTMICKNVCSVNLIVFPDNIDKKGCAIKNTVNCNVKTIQGPLLVARNGLLPPGFIDPNSPKCSNPTFESTMKYSIFDPMGNETWLDCEQLDENQTKVTIVDHLKGSTKSIHCPLFTSSSEPRPVIIRMEEKCKIQCTNFPCLKDQYEIIDRNFHPANINAEDLESIRIANGDNNSELDSNSDLIVIGGIIGVVIGIIAFVAILSYCLKSVYKRHKAEKELAFHPTFYAENPNRKISESVISEQTERTDLTKKEDYINMFNIDTLIINDDSLEYGFDEFSNMNDDSEEGKYIIFNILNFDLTIFFPIILLN